MFPARRESFLPLPYGDLHALCLSFSPSSSNAAMGSLSLRAAEKEFQENIQYEHAANSSTKRRPNNRYAKTDGILPGNGRDPESQE
jgi:hypothetical protein